MKKSRSKDDKIRSKGGKIRSQYDGSWKRSLAAALAAVLLLGAAGCGKKENNEGGGDGSLKNAGSARENVYTYEDLPGDLGEGASSSCEIKEMRWKDGRLHITAMIWEYEETASRQELIIRESGLKGEDAVERRLDFSGEENENQLLQKWVGSVALAADGSILGQVEENITINPGSENEEYTYQVKICCWGSDDSLQWEKEVSLFTENTDNFYISGIFAAPDSGWYVLASEAEEPVMYRVSREGEIADRRSIKRPESMASLSRAFLRADGKLLLQGYASDWMRMVFAVYDPETGSLGEVMDDGGVLAKYNMIGYDSDSGFLLTTGNAILQARPGENTVSPLMDFINSDFGYDGILAAARVSEEQFVAAYVDHEGMTRLSLFTHVPPEEVAEKKVLTLGAHYIGGDLRKRIIDFNKQNPSYRITIKDYSAYVVDEDYDAGAKQLANDIVAGRMPDILVVDSRTPVSDYAAKGLLANVDDLIRQDEELSGVTFMDNVFEAYRIDGKLYQLIPYFNVSTVLAKASVAEGHQDWTMDEMLQTVRSMGEDVQAFDNVNQENFFELVMRYSGSDFIDVSTGKCNFNTPQFIQLLEFAATLPKMEEVNWEEMDWTEYENRFRNNKVLLNAISLYSVRNMNRIEQADFGEKAVFVGFPSSNKRGSAINIDESYLISSKSAYIEGAWEFLRSCLLEDFQRKNDYGMSVRRDVFVEKANEATRKPYYTDENGNRVEYEETIYVNDQELVIPLMTQERVDEIVAFIESVRYAGYSNSAVLDIINEEAAGFFANQKSAQDVAGIIQSRVQIYVDERR